MLYLILFGVCPFGSFVQIKSSGATYMFKIKVQIIPYKS